MVSERDRLREILTTEALRRGNFTLSSGRSSSYYVDGKMVTLLPEGIYLAGRLLFERVRDGGIEAVGGLTIGADPLVTAIAITSYLAGQPISAFIVRKEPKPHGTHKWLEGPVRTGARVAIIDDVVTTGRSTLQAIESAQVSGCTVVKAVAMLDRCEGATDALARRGIALEALFTIHDLGIEVPQLAQV